MDPGPVVSEIHALGIPLLSLLPGPFIGLWLFSGRDVIPFTVGDITSGAVSYGHRFQAPQAMTLNSASASDYLEALRQASVLVDPEERREKLDQQLEQASKLSTGPGWFLIRSWCRRILFWWNTPI